MKKLFGGTLVLALASLAVAAPQNPPATGDTQGAQTGTKSGKRHGGGKHHNKKAGKNGQGKGNTTQDTTTKPNN